MKRYQEMTAAEKDTVFANHPPVHHVFWVLEAGQRIGHVYAISLQRAGKVWRDTGARQAWIAVHRLGQLGDVATRGGPIILPVKHSRRRQSCATKSI